MSKKWYESKTVWTGVIVVLAAFVASIEDSADWRGVALACLGAAIVYLRSITSTEITWR